MEKTKTTKFLGSFSLSKNGGGAGGTTNYEDLTNKPQVNGVTLSGNKTSADLGITTLTPFPSTWPTTGKFEDLLAAIRVDTIAVKGASFLGEVTFDDLPANLGNAEIKVEILEGTTPATKVIHSVITSGNREPYRWEYTSWNSGNSNSGWISFQLPLTAGDGISIENNVISTTVGNVYAQSNLLAGKGIEIVNEPVEGGIDEHTLACWHFDGKLTDEVKNEELESSLSDTGYKKFGSGACSGYVISSNNVNLTSNDSFTVDFWYRHGDTGASSQFSFGLNGLNRNNTESNRLNIIYKESKGGLYLEGGAWSNTSIPVYNFIPVSDTFYHFALVYDNATREINLFLNGISIFNQSLSTGTKLFESFVVDNSWRAGCDLDELRISDIARPLTPDGKFPVPTQAYSVAVPTGNKVINNTGVTSINTKKGNVTLTADDINVTYTHEGAETTTSIKEFADTIDHAVENINSLIPVNAYTAENLIAGKNITIEEVLPEGGIDEHTLACWHFDENLEPIKFDSQLTSNVQGTIKQDYYKFGNGSCSGPDIRIMNSGLNTSDFTVDYFFMPKDYIGGSSTYIGDVRIYINGLGVIVYFNNNNIYEFSIKQYGIWTHFAIRRKDLIYTIYVNGQSVFQSTEALTTKPTTVFNAATGGAVYFYIDELRISDIARPLTADGKFPVPTQPYSVAEPTGKVAINNAITKTSQLTNDSGFLTSVPENLVTSDNVTKIVKLTQAEYDQLETKDDSTFYAIVG